MVTWVDNDEDDAHISFQPSADRDQESDDDNDVDDGDSTAPLSSITCNLVEDTDEVLLTYFKQTMARKRKRIVSNFKVN